MGKIILEPSRSIYGQCFDEKNENVGRIDIGTFELSLSEDNDGVDFFMHHPERDRNSTCVCTVLSPDECEILADNLRKMAELARGVTA